MPRGIPNKPKEAAEQRPESTGQKMYGLYVKGARVQDIADKFNVEAQEVIEAIKAIEQKRGK